MEEVLKQFGAGSILWISDPKGNQPPAARRRRTIAPAHSGALRTRRHSRLPHHLSGADRHGLVLGYEDGGSTRNPSPRKRLAPPAFSGPSLPWSISPAMPAGDAWSKALAKILTSEPPWLAPRSWDFRASNWARPITCWPAPSISPATARPTADATTIPPTSRKSKCGTSTCRRSKPRSMPAPEA